MNTDLYFVNRTDLCPAVKTSIAFLNLKSGFPPFMRIHGLVF